MFINYCMVRKTTFYRPDCQIGFFSNGTPSLVFEMGAGLGLLPHKLKIPYTNLKLKMLQHTYAHVKIAVSYVYISIKF